MALTAHWMGPSPPLSTINLSDYAPAAHGLHLRSSLIGFHRVHGDHDGENLATHILDLIDRAGIAPGQVLIWMMYYTYHSALI